MKPLRFLLPALCACLFCCGAAAQPQGAVLRFAQTSHDFGDVARKGGDLTYEFAFTNAGDAPLVLTRVITSCSCLKASFSKKPVAPGGSGVVRIVYEPHKAEPGVFNKVIQVCSNAASGRDLITVQGNSIDGRQPVRKIRTGRTKVKIK
ncbi:DUF1573 domain-containing protein [Alistipes sp.]|uniref:DUF1573 domain-containing protein n=1 Tax=Alistipes sp. TaxID=1872444 RepID=UPI003AF01724